MNAHETTLRFREELASLREKGCTMLVVGEVPTEVSQRACSALCGDPATERVAIRTGGGCTCLDHPEDAGHCHTVEWAGQARGAAAATEARTGTGDLQFARAEGGATEVRTLAELGEATTATVKRAAEGADTGDLRLCVDSLGPLVEASSERAVFKYLHQLNAAVRDAGGIGHVHLPMDRETDRATVLGALFDVTVELELFGGEPRQRWYLHEAGIVSDWLPVGVSGE
jgi:hypothetical protein